MKKNKLQIYYRLILNATSQFFLMGKKYSKWKLYNTYKNEEDMLAELNRLKQNKKNQFEDIRNIKEL